MSFRTVTYANRDTRLGKTQLVTEADGDCHTYTLACTSSVNPDDDGAAVGLDAAQVANLVRDMVAWLGERSR